jgi:hypothetical protein
VVAAVLCSLLGLYSALLSFAGLFIGFYSDACGDRGPCHTDQLTAAVWLGLVGPPVLAVALIVVAVIRGRRRRAFAWIFPLAGFVLVTVLFVLANALGAAAIGLDFWTQKQ